MTFSIGTSPAPDVAAQPVGPTVMALLAHANALLTAAPEPSTRLASLLTLSQRLRTTTEQPVVFRPALFWQDGEPIIWPRTVNLVQGQTGVHKSRVAELFGSVALAAGRVLDTALGLEFRPFPGEAYQLIYVDTERNISDQLPSAIQNLKAKAGYSLAQHPPNFEYTSLVMLPRTERFTALTEYLAYQRRNFDGHLLVILDVLSDCVADFNDVEASLNLLDLLNVAVNEQNATFLAVIHENPGSMAKARGHLGTEATNKASTVLQVGFVKENGKPTSLIQLLYLKRRYGTPGLVFFATFSEDTKGLIRADPGLATVQAMARTAGVARKVSAATVLALLPELLGENSLQAGKLATALVENLTISNRTAKTYLAELLLPGAGCVTDSQGRPCRLSKGKASSGTEVLYQLRPVTSTP